MLINSERTSKAPSEPCTVGNHISTVIDTLVPNSKFNNNARGACWRTAGQILLPGTELYHYKARVYHPKLGRFMQTDPIGYKDDMNW